MRRHPADVTRLQQTTDIPARWASVARDAGDRQAATWGWAGARARERRQEAHRVSEAAHRAATVR